MTRILLAVLPVALLFATPAMADPQSTDGRVVSVRHDRLELTQEADAALMLARLERAAAMACQTPELRRAGPAARRALETCRLDAVAQAIQALDAPLVTDLHARSLSRQIAAR